MKRVMYGTIALFVGILIIVMIVAERNPVRTVKYENGSVVEDKK